MSERADVVVVNLNPRPWTECHACGAECPSEQGLPVDDTGAYVENDYQGEWAGVPACRECYNAHKAGGVAELEKRIRLVLYGKT